MSELTAELNGKPELSSPSTLDGKAPEATDFANYFCTYSYIYHVSLSASSATFKALTCHWLLEDHER